MSLDKDRFDKQKDSEEKRMFRALWFLWQKFQDDATAVVSSPSEYLKKYGIPNWKYAAQYLRENGWIDTRKQGRKWLTFWDNKGKRPTMDDAEFLLAETKKFAAEKKAVPVNPGNPVKKPGKPNVLKDSDITQKEAELVTEINRLKDENAKLRALLKLYL